MNEIEVYEGVLDGVTELIYYLNKGVDIKHFNF